MKRQVIVWFLVLIALSGSAVYGCSGSEKAPEPPVDIEYTSSKVCWELYNYLSRNHTCDKDNLVRSEWTAEYKGNGQWTIDAIGAWDKVKASGGTGFEYAYSNVDGRWLFTESTGAFQPINEYARNYREWCWID